MTPNPAPTNTPDPADTEPSTAAEPPTDTEPSTPTQQPTDTEPSTAAEHPTADAAATSEPDAPGPSPDVQPKGGRVTRVRVGGAVVAMVLAAVAATAVLQWTAAGQAEDARAGLEAERALRLEVSGAASAFSKALLSYDYKDLQSTRATLTAQATGDFLTTYDTAFGGPMAEVIVKLKATSQATVREVYLADVDEATAHAIVVVDQQVNTSEAIRSVKDSHLKIALVKEKGAWKVHDVTVLGAASEDQYSLDGGDEKKKD